MFDDAGNLHWCGYWNGIATVKFDDYSLEATADLRHWAAVTNVIGTNIDLPTPFAPQTFYRVSRPP